MFWKCGLKCSKNLEKSSTVFSTLAVQGLKLENSLTDWFLSLIFQRLDRNLEKFYSYLFYNSLSGFGSDVWKRPCGVLAFNVKIHFFDNQNKFCEFCRPRPRQLLRPFDVMMTQQKFFHFTFIRRENRITLGSDFEIFSQEYII